MRAARKLRVSQESPAERAHPDVHVRLRRKGRDAPGRRFLHALVEPKLAFVVAAAHLDHLELDARVGDQSLPGRRHLGAISVGGREVAVQHQDLAFDLCVGDVFDGLAVQHVDDDVDRDQLQRRNVEPAGAGARTFLLQLELARAERRVLLEQQHVRRHRAAGTVQGRGFAYGHVGLLNLAGLCNGRSNHELVSSMRSLNRRRQRTRCVGEGARSRRSSHRSPA